MLQPEPFLLRLINTALSHVPPNITTIKDMHLFWYMPKNVLATVKLN